MSDPTSTPPPSVAAVQKRQYRNQTAGWLGVLALNSRGDEVGVSIPPFGTRWMSDEEAILTARAPADPKNNPFEEQVYFEVDPANPEGAKKELRIRPLVLVSEARYVPAEERYLPPEVTGLHADEHAQESGLGDAPVQVVAEPSQLAARQAEITKAFDPVEPATEEPKAAPPVSMPVAAPPVETVPATTGPPSAPAAPQEQTVPSESLTTLDGEPAQSWTEPPAAPRVAGELGGENVSSEPAPPVETPEQIATASAQSAPEAPVAPVEEPAVSEAPAEPATSEETASESGLGEETGASQPPAGPAPEGEFAEHEEPGSPDAAAQSTGA
jgi:Predicted membrane protein